MSVYAKHIENNFGKASGDETLICNTRWTKEEEKDYIEEVKSYAKKYIDMGLAVIPVKFRDKYPVIEWKKYQEKAPEWGEISRYFEKLTNIGILAGKPSGGLVVFDFDDEEIYEKFKQIHPEIENTFQVKTSKGRHAYYRCPGWIIHSKKIGKVDIKAQGGLVVAPPSIHPSGAKYEILKNNPILEITEEKFEEYCRTLENLAGKTNVENESLILPTKGKRKLTKAEINKILEVLQPLYLEGYRDYIVLYLSGWLYKSNIDFESAKEIIEALAEKDEEKNKRLKVLERTYNDIEPEKVRGKSGLQEILTDVLISKGYTQEDAGAKTLEILNTLQEIIGTPSPYQDSIICLLNKEAKTYAVANFRRRTIYLARKTKDGFKYTGQIADGVPEKVIIYYDPFNHSTIQYEIEWRDTLGHITRYGPGSMEEIIGALKENGLVLKSTYGRDVITAIVRKIANTGRGEIKTGINQPGFYIIDGKISPVGYDEPTEIDQEELKEALLFLDEIVTKIYKSPEKVATIIKWGIVAPFSYIRKYLYPEQNYQKWLYAYGPTQAGKTTLGEIITHIWGVDIKRYVIPETSINTEARMGKILSSSTFPYTIREVGTIFENPEMVEMMKGAIEGLLARGKYERNIWRDIPSLAPIYFTSNKKKPTDPALLERFLVISFSREEVYSLEEKEKFKREIRPRLSELKVIGEAVYLYIKAQYSKRGNEFFKIPWEEMAEEVLRALYKRAKLEPPEWIEYHYEDEEPGEEEDVGEYLRAWFIDEINKAYRNVDYTLKDHFDIDKIEGIRSTEELSSYEYDDLWRRVLLVFEGYHIPWGRIKKIDDKDYIIIYRSILSKLPYYLKDLIQGNFRNLEDILRYEGLQVEYKIAWDSRERKTRRAIVMPLEEFVKFIGRESIKREPRQEILGG